MLHSESLSLKENEKKKKGGKGGGGGGGGSKQGTVGARGAQCIRATCIPSTHTVAVSIPVLGDTRPLLASSRTKLASNAHTLRYHTQRMEFFKFRNDGSPVITNQILLSLLG